MSVGRQSVSVYRVACHPSTLRSNGDAYATFVWFSLELAEVGDAGRVAGRVSGMASGRVSGRVPGRKAGAAEGRQWIRRIRSRGRALESTHADTQSSVNL